MVVTVHKQYAGIPSKSDKTLVVLVASTCMKGTEYVNNALVGIFNFLLIKYAVNIKTLACTFILSILVCAIYHNHKSTGND